jgi:hypothetical protein
MIELGNLSKVDRGEKHILPFLSPHPPKIRRSWDGFPRTRAHEGLRDAVKWVRSLLVKYINSSQKYLTCPKHGTGF